MGYVDIHSHVLYGLDDGAETREESVQMLELAVRSGTTDIVATPHANGRYRFAPHLIAEQIAELSAGTELRIYPGCDFHLQFDNIEDAVAHPEKYTINHKGYLLVEFPDVGFFTETDAILGRLLDGGMVPIVTHPERNRELRRHLDDIARWVQIGCYVQVTAGSYTGTFGKGARQTANELMHRGLTHFVASDAHDVQFRSPSLLEAYTLLADEWGEDLIRPLFVENPRAVLTGAAVDFELPPTSVRRRKWYQFW
ncbi:MAG: CpsB/CapC family capsule biosynthesis tyrosine phosphatase [Acidobacteriota bacterium]